MSGRSLMIVDDSMVFRNRIARLASDPRLGRVHLVAMAENGLEAIAQARHHRPDLVTMDLTMPVMDGPACLEELRTVLPAARILVVSALSDRATALRAMAKGAHGFLLKPFSDDQMVQSLQELMA
jgi:two-component system chemotaxis response regulator CheY